jgi:hypothetical protein
MPDPECERDRRLSRLGSHHRKMYDLACQGDIIAARMVWSDIANDLDDIQQLLDDGEGNDDD